LICGVQRRCHLQAGHLASMGFDPEYLMQQKPDLFFIEARSKASFSILVQ
jgi:hypothetical protein